MIRSHKTPLKTRRFAPRTLRGVSLLEAILALGLGGIVITQSVIGLSEYTSGVQVQATASKIAILNRAADRFAEDNYSTLLANSPEELDISVLEPYVGENIGTDAFGNAYKLSTRTYQITVPDPVNGGTMTEDALQVLIVGESDDPTESPLTSDISLRSDIANTAGASAGFISTGQLTCGDGAGGIRGDGAICGAFGSYSFDAAAFSATDFSDAAVVSLVTKGDSSVYGDQLYRYDYGDPELNSMHTDIYMYDNDLDDVGNITQVTSIDLDGGPDVTNPAIIKSTDSKDLYLEGAANSVLRANAGDVQLDASSGLYTFTSNVTAAGTCSDTDPCTDDYIRLEASNGLMRLSNDETVFGDKVAYSHDGTVARTGSGNIWANEAHIDDAQVRSINSLFASYDDALRLQNNREFGEVVVGRRVRYTPSGSVSSPGDAGVYEISDGDITAQHIQVQDITCADCGGSLAAILPKWRHMGTYFIAQGTQSIVPKPECTDNRRKSKSRADVGDNLAYVDSAKDSRYEEKIIVIPRQMATKDNGTNGVGVQSWTFRASDMGSYWITESDTQNASASALAKTYCVFVGNDPDPTSTLDDLPDDATSASSYSGFNIIE